MDCVSSPAASVEMCIAGQCTSASRSSRCSTRPSSGRCRARAIRWAVISISKLSHLGFCPDVQHGAWQASFRHGDDFPLILRPTGDDEAIEVHEERWSASGILRTDFGQTVALWGPVVLGTSLSPVPRIIVVSDSGAIVANDPALLNRLTPFHAVRFGGLLGVRRVRYITRSGLDALFAPQDVMLGWQLGGMIAPGATSSSGRDLLLAQSLYFATASTNIVFITDIEAEGRRDFTSGL